MKITYPFVKVFTDKTNKLNCFFDTNEQVSQFRQIDEIGTSLLNFCELDFAAPLEILKKLGTMEVSSQQMEEIKPIFWEAVDWFKDKHPYVHFFLNGLCLRTFYASEKSPVEQVDYLLYVFLYYQALQTEYRNALEICLAKEVLTEYTLPERLMILSNRYPDFTNYMLIARYGIAPVIRGVFDASKVFSYNDPEEVDTRKVLDGIHRDSETPVNLAQYFMVQDLEQMLYLEFMEMVKRGILIKRCSLCDRYFVLSDKRKREYCDRELENGKTCKQIGAKLKFNQSVGEDTYLQEFQRIYNRMYSRFYRMDALDSQRQSNKITEKEFKDWVEIASKARQQYKQKEISGQEMIALISEETST